MNAVSAAIQARLPLVFCKTDDILYTKETLSFLAGEEVRPFIIPQSGDLNDVDLGDGEVFMSGQVEASPQLYLFLKAKNKTLVCVNTKKSVLHFDGGPLIPPKDLVLKHLVEELNDDSLAVRLLPAFGGLTLKECHEALKLARESIAVDGLIDGDKLTPQVVTRVRQSFMSKLRGIVQVQTGEEFYDCPGLLETWMDDNAPFFVKPVHPMLTPRGLLFDGPPGTGKTSGAKHIAQEFGVPLFRMDVGAMKGKYVGDSEGNLNAALQQVDQMAPCVVIIDEVEKLFHEQHDSGVTSSLLGTLLWWLQEHRTQVFTVMTTNNKGAIPPELYREGRIDRVLTFTGLTTVSQAMSFALRVFQSMVEAVFPLQEDASSYPQAPLKELEATIILAKGEGAISQGRVVQIVQTIVKGLVLKEQSN